MEKSPLTVTYHDVLKEGQKTLKWMEQNFPRKVQEGSMQASHATRKIALQKELVKILRKHEPAVRCYWENQNRDV